MTGFAYRDRNIFGTGRTWRLGGDLSTKTIAGTTGVTDYDILGGLRTLSVDLEVMEREEPSFVRLLYGGSISAGIPVGSHQHVRLSYQIDAEEAQDITGAITNAESSGLVRDASIGIQWQYDRRDDFLLPTRGLVLEGA